MSLDGGGIKGVFAASFLAELEKRIGRTVGDYFDLIAGTSTGGIIALGLGMGISARELTGFYESEGPQIFAGRGIWRSARWLVRTKYDPDGLRRALQKHLGDRQLWESTTRLLIPSMSRDTSDIHIIKTPHHPDLHTDWRLRAVDVALATSAAPTFFPAARATGGPALLDGGVWANNPVALACVEAIGRRLRWPLDGVKVLSIGCTACPPGRSFFRARGVTGFFGWMKPLLEMMMEGQSRGALGEAKNILGSANVVRVNPTVARGQYSLDDVRNVESLIGLGAEQARADARDVIATFLHEPAESYEPCYRPSPADVRDPKSERPSG